ncbi:MAG: DNA-methyltransferase [Fluviibacter sp.]
MKLIKGDCLQVLKTVPDNSVDSVVTDPPYELGFMGKKWDSTGIAYNVSMWAECLRVLKPGGHLLAFSGSRTYHRMTVAIEDAGFEVRDQIMWVYGSGFPKSLNLKGDWQGWGTALKPAHEPICVARKPLIGTVAENVLNYGTGALNIDGCRVATDENLNGGAYANERQESASEWAKSGSLHKTTGQEFVQPAGRWPANFIHDGSEDVVSLFPHSKSGVMKIGTKRAAQDGFGSVCYGTYGGNDTSVDIQQSEGSAARFFYCAKASKKDRDAGLDGFERRVINVTEGHGRGDVNTSKGDGTGIRENRPRANIHPTVKPTDLMRYLCRLVTPPGGVVLDPFMGSGSTGKAATLEGFDFIGIEREAEYLDIANARINCAIHSTNIPIDDGQIDLFSHACSGAVLEPQATNIEQGVV